MLSEQSVKVVPFGLVGTFKKTRSNYIVRDRELEHVARTALEAWTKTLTAEALRTQRNLLWFSTLFFFGFSRRTLPARLTIDAQTGGRAGVSAVRSFLGGVHLQL